jgi:hypothetical protein
MEANDTYGFSFQNLQGRFGFFRHSASSAGAEVISIKRDGTDSAVGIGTGEPQTTLDVRNKLLVGDYSAAGFYNSNGTLHVRRSGVNPHIIMENIGAQTSAIACLSGGVVYATDASAGYHAFRTGWNNTSDAASSGTERMRINSTGVGIGTNSPGAPLTIYNANSTGNDPRYSHLDCFNPTNSAGQYSIISNRIGGSLASAVYYSMDVSGSHGFSIGASGGSYRLQFRDTWNFLGNERMSILGSGNVGIGSTNPDRNLVVSSTGYTAIVSETTGLSGSTGGPAFLLRAIGSPYTNSYVQLYAEYNAAGIAKGFFQVWNGASTYGQLNTTTAINQFWLNGYTTAGTLSVTSAGQVTSSSDARIKSNISTLSDNFTSNIMNLRPVYYTLNSDPEKVKIGFIAQDVENVIPEAVDGKKYEYTWKVKKVNENGGATVPDLDENGNLQFTDEIRPRGLDDRAIIACLVKAFQEQVVKSESLETQLQTAQNDIDLLESRLAAIEALISTNTSADVEPTTGGTRADALLSQV